MTVTHSADDLITFQSSHEGTLCDFSNNESSVNSKQTNEVQNMYHVSYVVLGLLPFFSLLLLCFNELYLSDLQNDRIIGLKLNMCNVNAIQSATQEH